MNKVVCIFISFILAACVDGYENAHYQFIRDFENGNYQEAQNIMQQNTVDIGKDIYLGGLQCGTATLWTTQQDNMCFDVAGAVLKNPEIDDSEYKMKDFEHIMLKTYVGIQELQNASANIKQTLNQAYSLQVQNVQNNDDDIYEAQQKLKEYYDSVPGLPNIDDIVHSIDAELSVQSDIVVPMKDYVNPYTTYLFALWDSLNGDKNNGYNYLKRVEKFVPDNKFIASDRNAIESGKNYVWVFFENGLVGQIKTRFLAPQILQSFDIRLSVPDVFPGSLALPEIEIKTENDNVVKTEFLASIDSVLKTDFDKYKTANIIKSVGFELAKTAAAITAGVGVGHAIRKHDKNTGNNIGLLVGMFIMNVEKDWDLRSWDSLPSQIQIARIEMPKNRMLDINGITVKIQEDIRNAAVFVRIPKYGAKPGIIVGKLN
ncbi:MAG: hypothetical protein ACLRFI_02375 [Alphaproteobacteria bacterium]